MVNKVPRKTLLDQLLIRNITFESLLDIGLLFIESSLELFILYRGTILST